MISITLPSIFPETLRKAHDNIVASTAGPFELIVVADFDRPSWASDRVVWVRETERRGVAHAHTVAAHHATGAFITATADDCVYVPGWDTAAIANYDRRASRARAMLCLGLHFGLVGTVFGIYYPNFPFLRRADALRIGYFDGNYRRAFTDSDLGLKVWSVGGRCEFTNDRLIEVTAEDKRKGTEACPPSDLRRFLDRWAGRYGQGFDTSHMRAINIDFDPDLHPELVDGFSIYDNTPEFVARATALSPPHLVESAGLWNIVWFRGAAYALPQHVGDIDLASEEGRARLLRAGGEVFGTIAEARSHIRSSAARAVERLMPQLVKSVGAWNIVRFDGAVHAVPQRLGNVDLASVDDRARLVEAGGATFGTVDEARAYVLRAERGAPVTAFHIETIGASNIVRYGDDYYVVPQRLGPIDMASKADRLRPEIRVYQSLDAAREILLRRPKGDGAR